MSFFHYRSERHAVRMCGKAKGVTRDMGKKRGGKAININLIVKIVDFLLIESVENGRIPENDRFARLMSNGHVMDIYTRH